MSFLEGRASPYQGRSQGGARAPPLGRPKKNKRNTPSPLIKMSGR